MATPIVGAPEPLDIRHIYTKTSIVSRVPKRLYCFKCDQLRQVKRYSFIDKIKHKLLPQGTKRPKCSTCNGQFNVIHVKMSPVSKIERFRMFWNRIIQKLLSHPEKVKNK
ncbi:hypothetical protein ECANGB1_1600 [Enterospora canceri]|uniref:Uncharacterized protein n=1 Tax=Enterospora canceri TaxID=1081671 RepID=A0A1Y1S5P6_9MICR|nr:hypothetical protein ECANGB1_1600 [Enterospora canceri]